MMTNLDHTLIRLADYPLLLALASKQTSATRLDGRACRYLYANATIDTATVSAHELDLIVALGVQVNQPTDMFSQLVSKYARARQKAVQRGELTPQEAAVLMDAYGEGIEHAMRVFLQEDLFQPNEAVNQIKAQVIQALVGLDPAYVLEVRTT